MSAPRWRKSSRSGKQDCIEVSHHLDAIRDSKCPPVTLTVNTRRLLDAVKSGRLDR